MDLVFLHGGAAAGKLTTARAIERRLGYPVFHNHLVVDLLTTVFPFGSEPFVRLREQMWLSVITDAARIERSLIFTFAPENTVQVGFPDRLRAAVEDNGGRLRSVRLDVSPAVQDERVVNPSRAEFHKLTDVAWLRANRAVADPVEQPAADLVINTDDSPPDVSAATIIAHFGLEPQPVLQRYPTDS
jgi:hypothetical protein